ncbi:hypothetical protein QYE76_015928 [Lolium multiflorum]|uniref:Uncharacterized protein n=1 Tax=Lolium multiflorum TaxID=4521 RepID=A0AAD8U3C6_LOLMU|nr:hypothetical protein QYE76_015928 [Lolium multiflorum]
MRRTMDVLKTIFLLLTVPRKSTAAVPGMRKLPKKKTATEAPMTRIRELQNTRGQELSGIQITAYFLRIRVQPLQARKNPLWKYTGDKDVDRLSVDLSVKDLEKLVRKISSLSKKILFRPLVGTIQILSLFLPFLKVGKSTNEPLSMMITKMLLALIVNPQPLIKEFIRFGAQFVGYRDYASKAEEKLAEVNERASTLAQKLEQSEEARKKAESDAIQARAEADKAKADVAGVEDLKKKLHDAETSLSEHIAAQSAREEAIIKRLRSQNRRFVSKTSQEFELEDPDNDPLLDALRSLSFMEQKHARALIKLKQGCRDSSPTSSRRKRNPQLALAKCFNPPEDLGLKVRQENMKVAVESTVALVADSQQNLDWTKVGDTQEMETTKWRSLIRAAKPNTKKVLAYLGITPTPAPSSSKPEV